MSGPRNLPWQRPSNGDPPRGLVDVQIRRATRANREGVATLMQEEAGGMLEAHQRGIACGSPFPIPWTSGPYALMNYFSYPTAAARYARGRPFFHPTVVQRIRDLLELREPLAAALDIGCGTGLSSVALLEISRRVVGLDAAAEMVSFAPRDPRIGYIVASAEQLPLAVSRFDLITLSQVIHWLDWTRFLSEARRVVRPGGWLVIYDNYFVAEQEAVGPEFQRWFTEGYLRRYPSPPRAAVPLTDGPAWQREGFHLLHQEQHENTQTLSLNALVDYLITQSNVIAAVEGGGEDLEAVSSWLTESLAPFFRDSPQVTFAFSGPIVVLQRVALTQEGTVKVSRRP